MKLLFHKVNHLQEDEGVLVALEQQGSIALTPNGKKVLVVLHLLTILLC
jgi:hypothetical protein